jgi:hypothetical protein
MLFARAIMTLPAVLGVGLLLLTDGGGLAAARLTGSGQGPPLTEFIVSQGDPHSGRAFVAATAIPTKEAQERLSLYHFECSAFVVRRLVVRNGLVIRRIGVAPITLSLASTSTDGSPEPTVCAWRIPPNSGGKSLQVVWAWMVFDSVSKTGSGSGSFAHWKIR